MNTQEKIDDLLSTGIFNNEEIEKIDGGFKSWTYYQIQYYTNEEYYYLGGDLAETLESNADEILRTEKGIAFCFS